MTKIASILFLNGTTNTAEGGVSNVMMSSYGISYNGTVASYFQNESISAFVSNYNGKPSNQVILGPSFFAPNSDQNTILVHEVLHSYTGMDDEALATALGLTLSGYIPGSYAAVYQASALINDYLQVDCDKSKVSGQ